MNITYDSRSSMWAFYKRMFFESTLENTQLYILFIFELKGRFKICKISITHNLYQTKINEETHMITLGLFSPLLITLLVQCTGGPIRTAGGACLPSPCRLSPHTLLFLSTKSQSDQWKGECRSRDQEINRAKSCQEKTTT